LEYPTTLAPAKPTAPPKTFEITEVAGERYIFCPIRNKAYKVDGKPEEVVRQWWLYRLRDLYGYDFKQIDVEVSVKVGSTEAKKKADIVVFTNATRNVARIFIEVKKPSRKDGIDQLQVYMNATGCRLGMWSNGQPPHVYLLRNEPAPGQEETTWRELRNIPRKSEDLSDVDSPITRVELEPVTDFLGILKECEDNIKAHEGVQVFEEIFKLIFAKLYDERRNLKNDSSPAQFRVGVFESPADARSRITKLFDDAKSQWAGVFDPGEEINLGDETLAFCVSALQKAYLLKSDADVLGSAFEVMINPNMKGDKGQYFTPRHVIDMCISALAPKQNETIFDPACGSGGFLVSAMDHVFRAIREERDDPNEILENQKDYASHNVFGIDYDRMIAKVAKAYMLIWGDGRSNIAVADGLNESNWPTGVAATFLAGSGPKAPLRQFDIIATNPPFAGDISNEDTLSKYELAYKIDKTGKSKRLSKVARDKLFVERCLKSLKPGGRMAIVLPRGTLKNYNDEYIRRHVIKRAHIVAVVSLTGSMFKPFTNTKTCVLFVRKRTSELADVKDAEKIDPPIVFAVSTHPGKDRSGALIRGPDGKVLSDLGEIAEFVREKAQWDAKEHVDAAA
jgi:type I restriction enzyme M protein